MFFDNAPKFIYNLNLNKRITLKDDNILDKI